jgi:hypothetical protein
VHREQLTGAGAGEQGVDGDQVGVHPQLDSLPGADLAGRDRVAADFEADQAVATDPAQVPVGHQVGLLG